MKIIDAIHEVFTPQGDEELRETFSSFSLTYNISKYTLSKLNIVNINNLVELVSLKDTFYLWIKCEIFPNTLLLKRELSVENFIHEILDNIENVDNEIIQFKIEINKFESNTISIYDFNSFVKHWETSSIIDILNFLVKKIFQYNNILFKFLDGTDDVFYSSRLSFGKNPLSPSSNPLDRQKIHEYCHFGNAEAFPSEPNDFFLLKRPNVENPIIQKLDILAQLFCIIGIYDITSISDEQLFYKLNGYKCHSGTLTISDLDKSSLNCYLEIFNWIYSSEGNISDKIGLARNILSIYLKRDSLYIPHAVCDSIQSGYKTYLQENLNKYIDIRGKITEELTWISQKSGELAEAYLGNYQKMIFAFLTFFLTVFILQIVQTDRGGNIFSSEISTICYAFLIIAIIVMLFSLIDLNRGKRRLSHKYTNLKKRYEDLLIPRDIENILRNDEEFKYEMNFIKKRREQYTWMWIISIIVLFITVFLLSIDYTFFIQFCTID